MQEVPFGPWLTDKAAVEPMLRRAQAAVLSGSSSVPFGRFLDMDIDNVKRGTGGPGGGKEARKALAFSRNTICMDLRGPELVDLSFVDLTGAWLALSRAG